MLSAPHDPFVGRALDATDVERHLVSRLAETWGASERLSVCAIRTVRYKPGRRCVIEYDVRRSSPGMPREVMTLVGKVRARGADAATFRLLQTLRSRGFDDESADGISVPEPVAIIPELGMWLQRKVRGSAATAELAGPRGVAVARRLADAAHKLHEAGVPTWRRHTMAEELGVLQERLSGLAAHRPEWAPRLDRVLRACDRLGAATPVGSPRGIHRDFYPDHAILDGERLYLLDFDLYAEGDPALDIGNCVGHITEQSLRALGDPRALTDREVALEDRFVELAGEPIRAAVRAYAVLTLVRHVSLSAQFPDRQPFTAALLELCEERLGGALRQRQGRVGRAVS